jgi:hypothetical protein
LHDDDQQQRQQQQQQQQPLNNGGNDARYEIKFAYPAHLATKVDTWLRGNLAAFSTSYPSRRVNNVYFDTPDLRSFADNLAGISERFKVRYRWYGEEDLPGPGTLEFKHKRASLGWKRSHDFAAPVMQAGERWRALHRRIAAALPPMERLLFCEHRQVVLVNRYERRYLESADRRLRATVDHALLSFDQTLSSRPNFRRAIHMPDLQILEIKCAPGDRRLASTVVRDCPVRSSRFSKYSVGVELR